MAGLGQWPRAGPRAGSAATAAFLGRSFSPAPRPAAATESRAEPSARRARLCAPPRAPLHSSRLARALQGSAGWRPARCLSRAGRRGAQKAGAAAQRRSLAPGAGGGGGAGNRSASETLTPRPAAGSTPARAPPGHPDFPTASSPGALAPPRSCPTFFLFQSGQNLGLAASEDEPSLEGQSLRPLSS